MNAFESRTELELPKHVRLVVYNYLSAKETFLKIALLSKKERESLKESAIAREGKVFELTLTEVNRPTCLLDE